MTEPFLSILRFKIEVLNDLPGAIGVIFEYPVSFLVVFGWALFVTYFIAGALVAGVVAIVMDYRKSKKDFD